MKTLFKNLYGYDKNFGNSEFIKFDFKKGDYVRKRIDKEIFTKGYSPNFSDEIFIIERLLPKIPPVYQIKSLKDEIDENSYYKEQLIKVTKDEFPFDIFSLEKEEKNFILKKLNSDSVNTIINSKEKIMTILNNK